ncbi:MAG: ABC transporter permease [Sedimentibacter sp.]
MWKKKIKKKKTQYALIGIVIFVTICIFSFCFAFTAEFSTFSQNVLTENNSSDVYMLGVGTSKLMDNISSQAVKDNIESYHSYKGSTVSVPILYNKKDVSMMHQVMLYIDNIDNTPEFYKRETVDNEKAPKKGEVWIPEVLASPSGIKLGDKITLNYDHPMELKVSGIYTASFLITSSFTFSPVIVSYEDLALADNEKEATIFAINLNNSDEEHITEMRDAFKYYVFTASRTQLLENFMSVASSVGSFGVIAAFIVFLVALAMIRYIVKITILYEFKSIGVYKSLGYTSKQICSFYIKGYMVVGIIAAVIGAFLPLPIVNKLGINCSQYAEGFKITQVSYFMSVFSIILFILLLYITLRGALKQVRKKSAVEIMNMGQSLNAGKKISHSLIKSARTPFQMAVNDIFKHKLNTLLILVVFILSTYLSLLFSMIAYSSYKMNDNGNLWFAIPKNNTYAMGSINDEFVNWLKDNDKVQSFVYGSLLYSTKVTSDDSDNSLSSVTFNIYNDASSELTGINIKGDAPKNTNEIVVTNKALALLEHKVGDTVNLEINGVKRSYKISGTYDSLLGNVGIMMTTEAMKKCNKEYTPSSAFITLKNTKGYDSFKVEVENKFRSITVDSDWFAIDNAMVSTRNMLLAISGMLIVVFIIFAMLNISIVLMMESANKHRQYGILKALGFTTGYIIRQNIWKNMLCVGISVLIAFIIHFTMSKGFLAKQVIDAFTYSGLVIALLVLLILCVALLLTYLISLGIRKIMPIELMEE